ncbi:MAG: hypothetical protein RJA07_831 [Bacteroidota bacterium]|jgi:hypothetical protein
MKHTFLSFLFLLFATALLAQQKGDTLIHTKKYFIGFNAGYGIGWRKNLSFPPDEMVRNYFVVINSNEDVPSYSYNVGLKFGYFKDKIKLTSGFNYTYLEYKNTKVIRLEDKFPVRYKHRFVDVPISFQYYLGRTNNWIIGLNVNAGLLFQKYLSFRSNDNAAIKKFIEPVFFVGGNIGRRIYKTDKIDVTIYGNYNYTTHVGLLGLQSYRAGANYFNSKEYHLIFGGINIEFIYKFQNKKL